MIFLPRRALLCLGAAAALAGCAAPPTLYYRLAALPGTQLGNVTKSIRIRNIMLPDYLDQTGIAKPSPKYQFASFANALWDEPLANMLQSTMVQNLSQRLPNATILQSDGGIGAPADIFVEINLLRFDPDPSGAIQFCAQIALRTAGTAAPFLTKTLKNSATPATQTPADIAATMSVIWAGAADQIAQFAAQTE